MKNKVRYVIGILVILCLVNTVYACTPGTKSDNKEPEIAVMYHRPDLAEEFTREIIEEFAPNPESLKITYCKAQYIPLYRAYVVNCYFNTDDAYGDMKSYKIQVTVQVLPDGKGGVKYNALDFEEIR